MALGTWLGRRGVLACVLGVLCALTAGARAQTSADGGPVQISIATGAPTGIYFAAGNAICRLVNRMDRTAASEQPLSCSSPATPGSIFNLRELRARNFTFAIVQSDWQYHAYRSSGRFEGQGFPALRSVVSLHPEAFQILAGRGTGIATFAGLKGKRVSLGEKGSGTRSTFDVVLQAFGVEASAFARTEEIATAEQNQVLCDGNIDAVPYAIGIPSAAVVDATSKCGATLVDLDGEALEKLVEDNSYYGLVTIPRGTYPSMDVPVRTFGLYATLVTREDTPPEIVYEVTRSIFESLDQLRSMHRAFAGLDPKRMVRDGLTAPLHIGAQRYFLERGLIAPGGK